MTNSKFLISNKIYLIGFFLILALPLLNLPPWFSPPDWGKTFVFRIILSILIFFFIWQLLSRKFVDSQPIRKLASGGLVFWLLIALLGIFLLATIFSLDPYFSLWGSPYRSGGFVNFAFYIIFVILVFLISGEKDWQKIWNFSILIGILVSIIAILQQFGIFSKIFIPFSGRPPSTIGGPIFLAIYLLLLSFLTLSFGIKIRNLFKKLFYFFSFLLFVFVAIFITQTRAVMIGFVIGFLYFLTFYPFKKLWLSLLLKIFTLLIFCFGIYGIYYLNSHPYPQFIQENKILLGLVSRLSIERGLADPRVSGWKVSWQALKSRPILGYGPENFSIGFDKYYDPALSGIEMMPGVITSWWDRAHNFIFDIGVTAGIPALIIYLTLFGVLFWQLQKLKSSSSTNNESSTNLRTSEPLNPVIPHGIQATFIAYLVANFFSFDTFSTYLISFSLIGYSLHLLSIPTSNEATQKENRFRFINLIYGYILKWRWIILFFLFVVLSWFIWVFNLNPFQVNKEINLAGYELKQGYCEKALARMENILPSKTFLDHYLRLKYIEVINECIKENPKKTLDLSQKATEILKENIKIRPYYTRNWLLLGSYTNILLEKEIQLGKEIQSETVQNLKKEANSYFEKANQLSPKRQEVFTEWIKTDLLTGEYQKAREKSQKCIELNEKLGECWWLMGLTQAYLKDLEKSNYYLKIAQEKGYLTQSKSSLLQLTRVYIVIENYPGLVETYSKLISLEPNNPQYHASLAVVYKELGKIDEAKKEALKVLELQPEAKEEVEEFLKGLSK